MTLNPLEWVMLPCLAMIRASPCHQCDILVVAVAKQTHTEQLCLVSTD